MMMVFMVAIEEKRGSRVFHRPRRWQERAGFSEHRRGLALGGRVARALLIGLSFCILFCASFRLLSASLSLDFNGSRCGFGLNDPGKGGSILPSAEMGMSPQFKVIWDQRTSAVGESSRRRRRFSSPFFYPFTW
jgi:hypothetical protein